MEPKKYKLIRTTCIFAVIAALLQVTIFVANPVSAGNGGGVIEFRLAERADTPKRILTEFFVQDLRGVKYHVSKSSELRFTRTSLAAVFVQELDQEEYGLTLLVDSSLWSAIETLTAAKKGNYLAILVDGILVSAARVLEPISDGKLTILYGRSEEEVFKLAKRFSSTPEFLPLKEGPTR